MKRSTQRILTTHVGSLIRPKPLLDLLRARQSGQIDDHAYTECLKESVAGVVRRQAEVGIDIVDDGEYGKNISWSQYALERLSGFERRRVPLEANPFVAGADRARFKDFYAEMDAPRSRRRHRIGIRSASDRSAIPVSTRSSATSTTSRWR